MTQLFTVIRHLLLGLVALAAGLSIFLLALAVAIVVLLFALLRGRRPVWQGVRFRRFGDRGSRQAAAADVVDIEAREVSEPGQAPHQRLVDSSSRISP